MQQYVFHSNTSLGKYRCFPFLGGGGRILLCRPGRTPALLPPHLAWYLFSIICVPLSRSHLWLLVMEPRALYLLGKCCKTEVYPDLAFCIDSSQSYLFLVLFAFGFWDRSYYLAQTGLKLIVLLPLLPQGWDHSVCHHTWLTEGHLN